MRTSNGRYAACGQIATLDGRAGAAAHLHGRGAAGAGAPVTSASEPRRLMAGRHARRAPVVISRALATVTLSALLLAVGVVAVTVFTGGERPATGGPRAQAPPVVTGPLAVPTATTTGSTPGWTRGRPSVGPSSSAGGGDVVGAVGVSGVPTMPAMAMGGPNSSNGSGTTSPGGVAPVGLPSGTAGFGASARGWLQRSDAGRAHGKAVGLLGRVAAAHGCRPVPKKSTPLAAQVEPRACR